MHFRLGIAIIVLTLSITGFARNAVEKLYFVQAAAKNNIERTKISNLGIAIDGVLSDSVSFLATEKEIDLLKNLAVAVQVTELPARASNAFPGQDEAFHDYKETVQELDTLVQKYPAIVTRVVIGKSLEGRDMVGVRISSNPNADALPTAVFMGCHHAREHLSVEVPLMFAKYLAENYESNEKVRQLIDTREVWIVPMINPDGAEYDISSGNYKYWRKNRRDNGSNYGVDLNRNYGTGWGGPGSSGSPWSDIYRGTSAFSEPETQAVRDFLKDRKHATVLISFHTFSELVLWPWGHKYDDVPDTSARRVFETMGKKMAEWNGYTPQKSSALYLASGDTTDWAYDVLKIFAYTFELSPSSMMGGGFYPGASAIDPTFKANIEPMLYLMEKAANPHRVLDSLTDPLGIL